MSPLIFKDHKPERAFGEGDNAHHYPPGSASLGIIVLVYAPTSTTASPNSIRGISAGRRRNSWKSSVLYTLRFKAHFLTQVYL